MSLASALEDAADSFPDLADVIRPANGDPMRLLESLERSSSVMLLGWLLNKNLVAGEELVEAWLEEAEGLAAILELNPADLNKTARKVIRRAKHFLRSRGIDLPKTAPEAKVVTLPTLEESFNTAAVTPIDPSGTRLLFIVEENPAGGLRLFEVTVSEDRGILGVRVYSAGRSKVRNFLKGLKAGAVAEVDLVKALIARAVARHPADRPMPASLSEWRGHLVDAEALTASTPGDAAFEELGDSEELDADFVIELAKKGEVGPWPPETKALEEVAQKIQDRLDGPIVLNEKQKMDQVNEIIDESLEKFFGETRGLKMSERYKESAYIHWKQGSLETAKACLAAARAFLDQPPTRNAVARYLVETPLSSVLPKAKEENVDQGDSLIVAP